VGHEQDTPLCDLAADARASTPTAAVRLVVPDLAELRSQVTRMRDRLGRSVGERLRRDRDRLETARRRLAEAPARDIERRRARLDQAGARLQALSPEATLQRGYAIVRHDGRALRAAVGIAVGDAVDIRLASGRLAAAVVGVYAPESR
jgi:exodeoxyribonuclease VII large subunit